jgi:hypothetical protein
MAEASGGRQSLTIDEGTVRTIIMHLRAYHAKEAPSGQNDGSNDTDDMHDDLEMNRGGADTNTLQSLYVELNGDERYDLAALALLGMEEANTVEEARRRAVEEGQPGMAEFLDMPLSPQFIAEGLERAGYPSGGYDPTREPGGDSHAA